jgi:hypothetical protein
MPRGVEAHLKWLALGRVEPVKVAKGGVAGWEAQGWVAGVEAMAAVAMAAVAGWEAQGWVRLEARERVARHCNRHNSRTTAASQHTFGTDCRNAAALK